MTRRPPLFSIALLSATILAFEVLVVHLFALLYHHQLGSMVIGLALLGYGASGTFSTLFSTRLQTHFNFVYPLCIVLFSLSLPGSLWVISLIPFHGEALFWDIRQVVYIIGIWLAVMVPFFWGAMAICLSLRRFGAQGAIVYGADLLGAGCGSLLIIGLLFGLFPRQVLFFLTAIALVTAYIACLETGCSHRKKVAVCLVALGGAIFLLKPQLQMEPSPYKTMQRLLQVKGAAVVAEQSSPLGVVQVVENPVVPFRYAPGLSVNNRQEPLPQLAVFVNGEGMSVITRGPDNPAKMQYLGRTTAALAYRVNTPGKVLILGIGGGTDLLQAKYFGAASLTGVELNPQLVDLLRGPYAAYSGHLLDSGVTVQVADIRGFLSKSGQSYDLIQLSLVDSFLPSVSGLNGLTVSYIYTVEAMVQYLNHLTDDGILSVTRWVKIPPRDSLKVFATAIAALRLTGVAEARDHLAMVRGWETSTLLVKKEPFTAGQLARIADFCRHNSFDFAYSPAGHEVLANQFNRLPQPYFREATRALLGDGAKEFLRAYKFNLQPATDDRPYFHHFFRWTGFREIIGLKNQGGAALLEAGYLVLLVALAAAILLSLMFILLPLFFLSTERNHTTQVISKMGVGVYFLACGLAFIFLEIAFLQKLVLFLHHPVYAISIGIFLFLFCGGLGSLLSRRLVSYLPPATLLIRVIAVIFVLGTATFLLFLHFEEVLIGLWLPLKWVVLFSWIAPLAIAMGMPFPLAVEALHRHAPSYLSWAWGINGCGSVIGALAATLGAIHLGFTGVVVLSLGCYAILPFCFPVRK